MTLNTFLAVGGGGRIASDGALHYNPSNPASLVERLRVTRNSIIGSRTNKCSLVNNGSMHDFVALLRIDLASSPHAHEIVALSATIVASLSNTPAPQALLQLLKVGVHDALLDSLKRLVQHLSITGQHLLAGGSREAAPPHSLSTDPLKLLESILRALRSILLAIAHQLSASPRWGIGSAWGTSSSSTGVSIPTTPARPGAGGVKIVGISGKEARGLTAHGGGATKDATMASASSDDLRAKRKSHAREAELEHLRELRLLSRSFLATVYSPDNLPYLVGPLFVTRVPQQGPHGSSAKAPRPHSPQVVAASGNGTEIRDVAMHSRASSSVGTSSPALGSTTRDAAGHVSTAGPTTASAIDLEELPLATRSKLLSITEMVCATIAGTVFIPGQLGPGGCEISPERELHQRRERLLNFTAADNPYLHRSQRPSSQQSSVPGGAGIGDDDEDRGRSQQGSSTQRHRSDFQAELIRKGSRSRSRLPNASHSGVGGGGGSMGDSGHLPLWEEEEGSFDLVDGNDEGPATVLSVLLAASECGFAKVQEAALWCLAELTRESADASIRLFRFSTLSGTLPTSMLLNLRRAASPNVRLAAFCCLAHIIKVHPFTPRTNQCVLEVLVELLDPKASGGGAGGMSLLSQGQVQIQVQAAFAVARLVADEPELQTLATENYDALSKLTTLLERACRQAAGGGQGGEPEPSLSCNAGARGGGGFANPTVGTALPAVDEGLIRLREACLSALAALTFQQDELRRKAVDTSSPSILSLLVPCLGFPALGVRVAACRLARALSRSISILRTSLVDAGIAPKLVALLEDEDEDEAVKIEATATLCNLMADFSPMRKLVVELGGLDRLVALAHGNARTDGDDVGRRGDGPTAGASQELRLNALWALKNMLWKCDLPSKVEVMDKVRWDFIVSLTSEGDTVMKEQALNILRNAAAGGAEDVETVVAGVGGGERLVELLEKVVWECKDEGVQGASVIEQVACCLVNIATGNDAHRRMIVRRPNLLDALVYFTNHPWKEIRSAAAKCVSNLVFRSAVVSLASTAEESQDLDITNETISRLRSFGMEERMFALANDVELDVQERARAALKKLDAACLAGTSIVV